ncbi:MAG: methyltransferase domain-containing protein [Candidatus Adiutrix sp.]|jgi:SAM-dependent methyltransferase|nr:methyltransferase domain-containing protein [Candidatus Adiutrix sp.]
MSGKNWTPGDIFKLFSSTWAGCALQAAVRLDFFTALDEAGAVDEALLIADLAGRLECDERALDMLVTALAALEFVERDGRAVRLTGAAQKYLSAKSDDYYGYIIKHTADILPAWTRLDQALKSGRRVAGESAADSRNEVEREAFLMGMFNVARQQADQTAAALELGGRKKLLDLGGGPGTYAVFFCRRYPELTATVFDQPETEKFAAKIFARYELAHRLNFVGGDFHSDELPKNYDVVWISQVLHGESPGEAAELIKKAAQSLNEGGLLCIQEFILDDDRRGPAHAALFSLNMLLQTPGGQAYAQAELMEMMTRGGLKNPRRLPPVPLAPDCGVIIGDKL